MFDVTKLNRIKNWVEIDMKYSRTFDMPKLRYEKFIPVFLWDSMADKVNLDALCSTCETDKMPKLVNPSAQTSNKFVPWYNVGESSDVFSAFCLEDHKDLDFLSIPGYTKGIPQPLKGKVFHVSLEVLNELDTYYENEKHFTRMVIEVYPSRFYQKPNPVFSYFNDVDQIATFDVKTQEYNLDSDIDTALFNTENGVYTF